MDGRERPLSPPFDYIKKSYIIRRTNNAPVAQLDRVPGYEPGGREFESLRAHQILEII